MLNVVDGKLTIDAKGIYSVENFLIARRFMYWQVYLHKTVEASEYLLIQILKRARYLVQNGKEIFASPSLMFFLKNNINSIELLKNYKDKNGVSAIDHFAQLDDYDITGAIKVWINNSDKTLALLCNNLITRNLPALEMQKEPFSPIVLNNIKHLIFLYK